MYISKGVNTIDEPNKSSGPVAKLIRHLVSNQGIPGSSSGRDVTAEEGILVSGMHATDEIIKSSGPVA